MEENNVDHWLSIYDSSFLAFRRNTVTATDGSRRIIGIELGGGSDIIITNNTVGRGSQIGLSVSTDVAKERIYLANNTFSTSETWGAQIRDDGGETRQFYLYNNNFSDAENDGDELFDAPTAGFRFNAVSGGAGIRQFVFDSNNIVNNDEIGLQFGGINAPEGGIDELSFVNYTITGNGTQGILNGQFLEVKDLEWDNSNVVTGNGSNNGGLTSNGFVDNEKPIAFITADDGDLIVSPEQAINFGFLYSDDGDIAPADVLWDFDEGLPVVDFAPTYTFTQPGTYTVALLAWDAQGRATRDAVQIQVQFLPGNFDGDFDVVGADFLKWQRDFGDSLDSSDLEDWEANFGATPVGATNVAVPEPASWLLACVMAMMVRGRRRRLGRCTLTLSLCVLTMLSAHANDSYEFQTVSTSLNLPTDVAFAPGQTDRAYVTEFLATGGGASVGRVSTIDLATGTRTTFLEVPGIATSGEGGVHSIAFHPDFQTNNKFYISWVIDSPEFIGGATRPAGRVDEYQLIGGMPTLQRTILELEANTNDPIHGIGDLNFDPTATGAARDYLYIGMGDGGPQASAPGYINRAQDLSTLYGKILRVSVDGTDDLPGDPSRNYSLPGDNPYNDANGSTDGAVWLSGLRNPWRFSFDSISGDMVIGDVGFNTREELNFVAAGDSGIDFGWAQREGTIATPDADVVAQPWYTGLKGNSRDPFFEGDHDHPNHDTYRSIAGGFVYRGPIAALQGKYLFADTNTDKLFMLNFDPTTNPNSFDGLNYTNLEDLTDQALSDLGISSFSTGFAGLVAFGEDASGNLYFASFSRGEIYSIASVLEPSADYDGDIDVDGADFLKWQRGESTHSLSGGDLALWESQFGSTGILSTATHVPEPSSILLAMFSGLLGLAATHRCGRVIIPLRIDALASRFVSREGGM